MLDLLKRMRLGGKIGMGFGLIILMAALLGYVAWSGVGRIHSFMSQYVLWVDISAVMTEEVNQNALKISSAIEAYTTSPHDANKVAVQQAVEGTRKGFEKWATLVKGIPSLEQVLNKMKEDLTRVDSAFAAHQNVMKSNKIENYAEMEGNLKNSIKPLTTTLERVVKEVIRPEKEEKVVAAAAVQRQVEIISILLGTAVIVIGVLLSYVVIRAITRPLNHAIAQIFDGSDHVSSAATQVAAASQQMADASSRQAASIEETSSSLEEMSAMTKQNADHAAQADGLMKEANHAAEQASQSMEDLTRSMTEISKASQETSKIVKTIDEIAFQTNLLALNAAVEAARAGEAGAGFAVVAGEVRNLALRAADAAQNTTQMIEGTVKNVNEGARLVSKTNEAFTSVAGGVLKAGQLVAEIAAASHEQAQGIEQLNNSVSEMDAVVQQIASSAEESASASLEMNGQAERMKGMVSGLVALVGGAGAVRSRRATTVETATTQRTSGVAPRTSSASKDLVPAKARVITPKEVIPLEEGEFKNF
jgi:methyl-accepting chemotaxis protein